MSHCRSTSQQTTPQCLTTQERSHNLQGRGLGSHWQPSASARVERWEGGGRLRPLQTSPPRPPPVCCGGGTAGTLFKPISLVHVLWSRPWEYMPLCSTHFVPVTNDSSKLRENLTVAGTQKEIKNSFGERLIVFETITREFPSTIYKTLLSFHHTNS